MHMNTQINNTNIFFDRNEIIEHINRCIDAFIFPKINTYEL